MIHSRSKLSAFGDDLSKCTLADISLGLLSHFENYSPNNAKIHTSPVVLRKWAAKIEYNRLKRLKDINRKESIAVFERDGEEIASALMMYCDYLSDTDESIRFTCSHIHFSFKPFCYLIRCRKYWSNYAINVYIKHFGKEPEFKKN